MGDHTDGKWVLLQSAQKEMEGYKFGGSGCERLMQRGCLKVFDIQECMDHAGPSEE